MFPSALKRFRRHLLLRTAVFELRLDVVARLLSKREVDSECAGYVIPKFRSAGLGCVAVGPLCSVVMPGSASFNPDTTA